MINRYRTASTRDPASHPPCLLLYASSLNDSACLLAVAALVTLLILPCAHLPYVYTSDLNHLACLLTVAVPSFLVLPCLPSPLRINICIDSQRPRLLTHSCCSRDDHPPLPPSLLHIRIGSQPRRLLSYSCSTPAPPPPMPHISPTYEYMHRASRTSPVLFTFPVPATSCSPASHLPYFCTCESDRNDVALFAQGCSARA